MDEKLMTALQAAGVETEQAVRRFGGNSALYMKFLVKFLDDPTFETVTEAFQKKNFEEMVTSAHTLKGVSANLGMMRLYEACSKVVALLRSGETETALNFYGELEDAYRAICKTINDAKEK